jgi:hypothetical protein
VSNFRFYRRVRLFPGLSVNLSKSGPSLTMGMRGAHVTVGSRGVRRTVGIPGTGAYWTSTTGHHTGVHSAHIETPSPGASAFQRFMDNVHVLVGAAIVLWLFRACMGGR